MPEPQVTTKHPDHEMIPEHFCESCGTRIAYEGLCRPCKKMNDYSDRFGKDEYHR